MICGSGGSTSRLAKAAGAEPCGQMRDEKLHAVVARSTFGSQNVQSTPCSGPLLEVDMSKKCTPLWREAHLEVKMYKTYHARTHFWKLTCRKSARHCGAKHISKSKVQKTDGFGHFWKLRRRKSAHGCGAKHISKSKVEKTDGFGDFWKLRRRKVQTVVARSTILSQTCKKLTSSDHFWTFRCRFAWQAQG